jgi:hypothetical protein
VDNQSSTRIIKDVLYVPGLGTNLFSIAAATSSGLEAHFSKDMVSFHHGDELVLTGKRSGNTLYLLDLKPHTASTKSNRTPLDAARSILLASNLPSTLWAEAVGYVVYIRNRVLSSTIKADPCVYFQHQREGEIDEMPIILIIYVDDGIILNNHKQTHTDILEMAFEICSLPAHRLIGIDIIRDRPKRMVYISQPEYVVKIAEKFNMCTYTPPTTPADPCCRISPGMSPQNKEEEDEMKAVPHRKAVGSLMHIRIMTRTDYAGDLQTRHSTSGFVSLHLGRPVPWASRRQPCVALSTTGAEFIAAADATKEAVLFQQLLSELGIDARSTTIYCDNQSVIALVNNPTFTRESSISMFAFLYQRVAGE